MPRAIFHVGAAALLLFAFVCNVQVANAQIAPTNTAAISGSVSDSGGKPVANAKVSLSGPKSASTKTDANGLFVFIGVPLGTYSIAAAAAGLGTATRTGVMVQGDTNVAIQYEPASVNGLKVIAKVSSSVNARFNVTSASVTQVNPIANAFDGKTSWRTILEQIPGVAQAGLGTGGNEFAAFPDGPLVPVKISINGGLPYETATLLDDMPLIGSSRGSSNSLAGDGTDLGVYPLNAFGAADVVRGPGANSPSIVDSIGGSFVLHAPGAVSSSHYDLSLSTDPYGGIVANALAAVRWKKLSVVMTYGVNDSPGPTNSANIPAQTSFEPYAVNGSSFIAYSPPCPSCVYGSYLVNPNYASSSFPFYGYSQGLLTCCTQASSAWSQHSGSIAINYALSPFVTADIFYAGQISDVAHSPCADVTDIFTPPAGYTGSIPTGQLQLSLIGDTLAPFPSIQASSLLEEKVTARIGNGTLQLAALQNRTFAGSAFSGPTSVTQQLFGGGCIASATTSPGCPTGYASTVFNGETYNVTYTSITQTWAQTNDNRDLSFEYATPLGENFRAGASFVRSYYDNPCVFTYAYTAPDNFSGVYTIPSADAQTTNEFRIFVGGTPLAKTSIDLSMYFTNANYHVQNPNDSTGNTYVDERYNYAAPRLGFVWRPTAAIAVRAAVGGGFAEAPLDYLGLGNGYFQPNGTPDCSSGTYCTVSLTNLKLQPEKSFGFDLGTDVRLRRNTVLSFDVYRSNLYGQFYQSTSVTGTYLGLPLYTTQYGNLSESRYEGVLLDVRHDTPHGIYWALSGGLTRGYVVNVPSGFYNGTSGFPAATCTNCANLNVIPNINFNGTFTGVSVPYSQALGKLGYRWNPEKYIDLAGTYYGNNNSYFRPAFVELDGHIGYPLTKNASLLVTFRNITGIYDSAVQFYTLGNFSGAPTIAGLPSPLWGEEYGPRTVIVTTKIHL